MWIRRAATAVALVLPLLTAACVSEAPQLMRDGADMYPAEAPGSGSSW